ncbi:MAG: hypothetical protein E7060_06230 [Treponema bryantii]|nr:hypothetical protein [Treponema bryantii]
MKKLLIGAAMLAAVFAFTGCLGDMGEGSKSGTKFNKTMIVNATTDTFMEKAEKAEVDEKPAVLYRRYFSELSTSKEVAAIETTITINKEDSIETAKTTKRDEAVNAVVGLVFDVHKTEEDVYDFVVVGVKPVDGKFYVERYKNVAKAKAYAGETDDGFDTTDGALVTEEKDKEYIVGGGSWAANPITFTEDKDGNKQFTVKIEQNTPKTYDILINGKTVGSYNGTVVNAEPVERNDGKDKNTFAEVGEFAVGGIGMYANCPEGTKLKVKYSSDKSKTYGLFIDEE